MAAITRRTREIAGADAATLPIGELIADGRPVILRGIAAQKPLVLAGQESSAAAVSQLKAMEAGRPVTAYIGEAAIKGRFAYTRDVSALNFERERGALSEYLDRILSAQGNDAAPSIYIGSTDIDQYLPGLRESDVLAFGDLERTAMSPLVSIWIGNRTTASAHYDMSNNIAVNMVGRRRFTLFPPEQVANLYPGPLDLTPAGQVVTMVDFKAPDLARYPRFRLAMEAGEVAELGPGDAILYPALWWHQVEALDPFNVMINYWWNVSPRFVDTPQNTMLHALLSLRDRPDHEKAGWRALFDYYVFGDPELPRAHLPEAAQGNLAPMDELSARRLRAHLLQRLNR